MSGVLCSLWSGDWLLSFGMFLGLSVFERASVSLFLLLWPVIPLFRYTFLTRLPVDEPLLFPVWGVYE
jgi:hypothetical protein